MARSTLLPVLLLVALAAAGVSLLLVRAAPDDRRWIRTTVLRVVDGDTIVLRGIGTARLIGVDTPEVHGAVGCFGPAASAYTKRRVRGRAVLVRRGAEPRDRYGRALVYVRRPGDRLLNGELLRHGYARRLRIAPNTAYGERFDALAARARDRSRGLWGSCR